MKEFVDIHDFMVSAETVGDMLGDPEYVADKINTLCHMLYDQAPEDISSELLSRLLAEIPEFWLQDETIVDADESELLDWVHQQLTNAEFGERDEHE